MVTRREQAIHQPLMWDDSAVVARRITGRALGAGMQGLWDGVRQVVGRQSRR